LLIANPGPQRAVAEQLAGYLAPRVRVFFEKRAIKPGEHWRRSYAPCLAWIRDDLSEGDDQLERVFLRTP
jgi:hypothetical protein